AGLLWYAKCATGDPELVFYRYPGALLTVLLWSVPLLYLLVLVDAWHLGAAWRARGWGPGRRLRHVLAVLVWVAAAVALWDWNLLGWKLCARRRGSRRRCRLPRPWTRTVACRRWTPCAASRCWASS